MSSEVRNRSCLLERKNHVKYYEVKDFRIVHDVDMLVRF